MENPPKVAVKYFDLYGKHRKAVSDYFHRSQVIAFQFGKAIREYLELPEYYLTPNKGGSDSWTRFYQWDSDLDEAGAVATTTQLNEIDATGTLRFALGLALSHTENSFPKMYMYMACSIVHSADAATLTLGVKDELKRFELDLTSGTLDFTAAVAAYLDAIETALARPPFGATKPSRSMGFIES